MKQLENAIGKEVPDRCIVFDVSVNKQWMSACYATYTDSLLSSVTKIQSMRTNARTAHSVHVNVRWNGPTRMAATDSERGVRLVRGRNRAEREQEILTFWINRSGIAIKINKYLYCGRFCIECTITKTKIRNCAVRIKCNVSVRFNFFILCIYFCEFRCSTRSHHCRRIRKSADW